MLTLKNGSGKEMLHRFFKSASGEIRILKETAVMFTKCTYRNAFIRFASTYRKKEAIAVSVVLVLSLISSAIVVGTGYRERKINSFVQDMIGTQILGNENTVATKTLSKIPETESASANTVAGTPREDIFTPSEAENATPQQ